MCLEQKSHYVITFMSVDVCVQVALSNQPILRNSSRLLSELLAALLLTPAIQRTFPRVLFFSLSRRCNNPKAITQKRVCQSVLTEWRLLKWQGCESVYIPCKNSGNKREDCHWSMFMQFCLFLEFVWVYNRKSFHEISSLKCRGVTCLHALYC